MCVTVYINIYIYIKCINMTQNNHIFARLERETQWEMTKNIFIYSGKLSNIAYLWVAKVCEYLELAVNLKVKLESICSEVFSISAMTIRCQYMPCFIQRTEVWSCLWKCIMARTKEMYEDLKKKFILLIRLEKVTKTISKEFGLHKWRKFKTTVTFPRSGRPTKITPKQDMTLG